MDFSDSTESEPDNQPICVLCKNSEGKLAKLGEKGCRGLVETSKRLGQTLCVGVGQFVHAECRRKYCHPNKQPRFQIEESENVTTRVKRSTDKQFDFKKNCIFCGNDAKHFKGKRGNDVYPVRTLDFQNTIKDMCTKRNDKWAESVLGRLEYAVDLPAVEARYHQTCSANFRTGLGIPLQQQQQQNMNNIKKGRPSNSVTDEAFSSIINYLEENMDKQITVLDLVSKMEELCGDNAYSSVYMKKRLLDHFGCEIVISELDGKHNVITFKTNADAILHSFHRSSHRESGLSEKNALIKTSARLIMEDIRTLDLTKYCYPDPNNMMSVDSNKCFVPPSLLLFLQQIINCKRSDAKVLALSQSIIQQSSPRGAIMPLQIGLGVQMHHHFGSKFLIDTLHSLGFCSSYAEVQKFEAAAASTWNFEIENGSESNRAIQFIADNVDHNLAPIDGHNTFHGMGIIATVTPGVQCARPVPRVHASHEDLAEICKINIKFYSQTNNSFDSLIFQSLKTVKQVDDPSKNIEFLLNVARPLKLECPSWSGFMQTVQTGSHSGQSSVVFLPMIDMNPSDLTCIFSTLCYVVTQSKRLSVTPILTFDQPLYWKAVQIIQNEKSDSDLKSIILRLGGFHTEMSFLGCIGQLMLNSGLQELIETVYAPNTVTHMLSGKAVSRAVRAHFLIDDALNTLLVEKMFPGATRGNHDSESSMSNEISEMTHEHELVERLQALFKGVHSGELAIESVDEDQFFQEAFNVYINLRESLKCYRTAKLWLQYMDMISILKSFIKAERTGNWELHLMTMNKMLPYFAAAGHHMYLKSGYIYLQEMASIKETHPEVYELFINGKHVVRRSDRFWAGISTDLMIEQVLMRSLKSTGGMTRGRGMSESQRAQWLLSMPACSDVNNAMQIFSGQTYDSSDQHKEARTSRVQRDTKDVGTLVDFLRDRSPFAPEPQLRNIETGCVAEGNVNVDNARVIGEDILKGMENQTVAFYSFKKSQKAVTLGINNSIKIGEDEIQVDPQLLFQRLLTVSDISLDNPLDVFKYELCSHPASLFDSSGLMRQAQKPILANAIWDLGSCGVDVLPQENISFVLDGGSLLHRLPWAYGSTFGDICESYCKLVLKNYRNAHVVFDGYSDNATTKDQAHERRSKGFKGTNTFFDENTPFKSKKELFLANSDNKQSFISMLGASLSKSGCKVSHSSEDADVLIVKTAVSEATEANVIVIGEDTDLLVLLCFYANHDSYTIYFTSDVKAGPKVRKIWNIHNTINVLGDNIRSLILFVHAFSGCDTTSRIFGIGKSVVLKKVMSDPDLRSYANVFLQDSTQQAVAEAGEAVLVKLFNGTQCLDLLRYCKFLHKVQTKKSAVLVNSLPPTSNAAKYHSFRVYLQVQTWLGKSISPLEWGWKKLLNKYVPIKCTLPAAPDRLLKMIRCGCKQNCDSRRCTCKKHGLNCSSVCVECHGISCSNRGGSNDDSCLE